VNGDGEITPLFALIFGTVLLLTLISMGIMVWFVFEAPSSAMAKDVAATCSHTWKTGAGAIFGLLMGKAA
jgi:hypothetical protein